MKLSALFLLNAVVASVFGLLLAAIPGAFLANYGIEGLTAGNALVARLFGVTLITIGVLCHQSRESASATSPAVTALFVGNTLGLVTATHGMLTGAVTALGWSNVAIYFVLAAAYGYFRIAQPAPQGTPAH